MSALFNTRITQFFNTRLPIVAGGMQWLSTADYVAAAARSGMMGFITAGSFPTLAELQREIRRCSDLVDGRPFGVNVSMLPKMVEGERINDIFALIVDEGVRFVETAGRNPQSYLPLLHSAGIKVLHKVPAVKYAVKAEAIGVDAVSIVGAECGGHPGMELIGTIVQAAIAARDISLPLVIGGGIGTGAQIVAALALGADGVIMGTRFLVSEEIWAHADYKERLIRANETDTVLVMKTLRNTLRALRNDTTQTITMLEKAYGGNLEKLMPHMSGKVGKVAYETGNASTGALAVGQAVGFADRIEPLSEIVNRLESEMTAAMARLQLLAS